MPKERLPNLRLSALEAFVAASEDGYAEAAQALGCDPSTISRQITDLEIWLRCPALFDDNRPKNLTNAGRAFLPIAQEVIDLLKKAQVPLPEPGRTTPIAGSDLSL